jgi:hypothetical protein
LVAVGSRESSNREYSMSYQEKARHVLRHGTATEKATALMSVSQWNDVPDEIVKQIDFLREDRSVARIYAPFRYGELGYLASRVYALIQCRRGLKEAVTAHGTVIPLKGEQLSRLCEEHHLAIESDDPVDWFTALRDRGLLALVDETFDERSFHLSD